MSDLFVQWRDSTAIYGLSFSTAEDAAAFTTAMAACVKELTDGPEKTAVAPVPPKRRRSMTAGSTHAVSPLQRTPTPVAVAPANPGDAYNLLTADPTEQRDRIVKELYTTEKDYVANLSTLVEHCYQPVTKGKYRTVFSESERKMIYGNVEIILRMNLKFFQDLTQRLEVWHDQQTIGDIFIQMVRPLPPTMRTSAGLMQGTADPLLPRVQGVLYQLRDGHRHAREAH